MLCFRLFIYQDPLEFCDWRLLHSTSVIHPSRFSLKVKVFKSEEDDGTSIESFAILEVFYIFVVFFGPLVIRAKVSFYLRLIRVLILCESIKEFDSS